MTHRENLKIIGFVGLTGSGKTAAVDHLTSLGYPKVYFGGVVLDAMKEAGLEWTEANERPFREELRQKEGKDFVVKRIIKQIEDLAAAGQHRIVADGIYSWTEYKAMKQAFPGELTVVAIVTPKSLRHHRLTTRPLRPYTHREADERDWAEIENLEKGGPIAIADYFVHNDRNLDALHTEIDKITRSIGF